MKKYILSLLAIACFSICMVSCGNKAKTNSDATEVADKTGKEYASAFVCPMHCKGSGSDKAGKCPTCKMDYVANKDYKAQGDHDGHDHGHDHDGHDHHGHDHGDHDGHDHDGHDHGDHDGHNH